MQHTNRLLILGLDHRTWEIIKGIQAYCSLHGKWEFHLESDSHSNMISRVLLAVRQWKAHGIIGHIRTDVTENLVRQADVPIVNVSGARDLNLPTVISDPWAVGKMGARHFLDSGYRNFAFVAKTIDLYTQKMSDGFSRELAAAGHDCNVFVDEFTGGLEADWLRTSRRLDRWLVSLPKPTGIMCAYDFRGQEVAMACHRLGLRVPDDVAILGVENQTSVCEICTPPLSSVDVDLRKIGYEAVRLLHRILRGGKAPSKPVMIAPRCVVIRQSSNMIATSDPNVAAAMRLIRERGQESLRVKELLQHLQISRKTLELQFLKILGRSPGAEILRVRTERIKSLLAETDLSMQAIARKTGFSQAEGFSAFFHRQTGLTPTGFRKRSRIGSITAQDTP